ncbi:MAG TPA: hypothetical protein DDW18_01230 [Firmicutes bacterium]|nr:hypothetical protein [Bacillota bacterium]HBM99975.1 hypothetical protein [Bacillota bacterium]
MERKITPSKITVLDAIYTLNKEGYQATLEGLACLLLGNKEGEALSSSALFGYLPSLSSKKIKNRVHYLLQKGYIVLIYDSQKDVHYLSLSSKGKEGRKLLVRKSPSTKKEKVLFAPIK